MDRLTSLFTVSRTVSSYARYPTNPSVPFHSLNILILNNKYYSHPTCEECAELMPQGLNMVGRRDEKGAQAPGSGLFWDRSPGRL